MTKDRHRGLSAAPSDLWHHQPNSGGFRSGIAPPLGCDGPKQSSLKAVGTSPTTSFSRGIWPGPELAR